MEGKGISSLVEEEDDDDEGDKDEDAKGMADPAIRPERAQLKFRGRGKRSNISVLLFFLEDKEEEEEGM